MQTVLSVVLIYAIRAFHPVADIKDDAIAAAGPAIALMLVLGVASVAKARLLAGCSRRASIGWRWPLVPAVAVGTIVGVAATLAARMGSNWCSACRRSSAATAR